MEETEIGPLTLPVLGGSGYWRPFSHSLDSSVAASSPACCPRGWEIEEGRVLEDSHPSFPQILPYLQRSQPCPTAGFFPSLHQPPQTLHTVPRSQRSEEGRVLEDSHPSFPQTLPCVPTSSGLSRTVIRVSSSSTEPLKETRANLTVHYSVSYHLKIINT